MCVWGGKWSRQDGGLKAQRKCVLRRDNWEKNAKSGNSQWPGCQKRGKHKLPNSALACTCLHKKSSISVSEKNVIQETEK